MATRAGHAVEHGVPRPVRTLVQAGLRHPRPVLIAGAAVDAVVATEEPLLCAPGPEFRAPPRDLTSSPVEVER
ncbi:hypothetical protein [Streptomyces curacoi]|uniref:hypothetical protein n=1 Tax=Streptomyces curacoi TaxID=146536 RepID=UPI000785901D|nr:hypothetical protein [Streptomyces curacoi]